MEKYFFGLDFRWRRNLRRCQWNWRRWNYIFHPRNLRVHWGNKFCEICMVLNHVRLDDLSELVLKSVENANDFWSWIKMIVDFISWILVVGDCWILIIAEFISWIFLIGDWNDLGSWTWAIKSLKYNIFNVERMNACGAKPVFNGFGLDEVVINFFQQFHRFHFGENLASSFASPLLQTFFPRTFRRRKHPNITHLQYPSSVRVQRDELNEIVRAPFGKFEACVWLVTV